MEIMGKSKISIVIFIFLSTIYGNQAANLSCYQCITNSNTPCPADKLLPCPEVSDRCVTHTSKDAERGFTVKRECGLGPCGFDDAMVSKGLGFGNCDMSRNEFFCISCCRESGCNNGSTFNGLHFLIPPIVLLITCHMLFRQNVYI